jgi:hypothetical protein
MRKFTEIWVLIKLYYNYKIREYNEKRLELLEEKHKQVEKLKIDIQNEHNQKYESEKRKLFEEYEIKKKFAR